jgi:hypothetical protein
MAGYIEAPGLILTLCFKEMPKLDVVEIRTRLMRVEPLHSVPKVMLNYDPYPNLWIEYEQHPPPDGTDYCLYLECYGVEVIGFDRPVSDQELDQTVSSMPWSFNPRDLLRGHQAQLRCTYKGYAADFTERIVALYKVAYCFAGSGMMGFWDENINVCHPTSVLEALFEPPYMLVNPCRKMPLYGLWMNALSFERPGGGTWFYTKGFYRFGIRDFAFLGQPSQLRYAGRIFLELFNQVFESRIQLEVGDTPEIRPGVWVSFSRVFEFVEVLGSPLGTLVVQVHGEQTPGSDGVEESIRAMFRNDSDGSSQL